MLEALQKRDFRVPWYHRWTWRYMQLWVTSWVVPCLHHRGYGLHNVPREGATLFACNHQSFLDPALFGQPLHFHPFYALARSSLWKNPMVGGVISALNAIPIDRGAGDRAAVKTCIEVLKAQQSLLMFPEGTRTPDGVTQPFKNGVMLIIKRARPLKVVPTAIEGSYDVWPRHRKAPKTFGHTAVKYGEPIEGDDLIEMGSDAALALLRERVETMRLELRERIERVATGPTW